MPRKQTNPDFLNGVPELLILKLLSRQPMHGYQLVQSISVLSSGQIQFGEGCVYPVLHRLELEGALHSRRQVVGGRSRVVYELSNAGKKRLAGVISRWQTVVDSVQVVLQGGAHGRAKLA